MVLNLELVNEINSGHFLKNSILKFLFERFTNGVSKVFMNRYLQAVFLHFWGTVNVR